MLSKNTVMENHKLAFESKKIAAWFLLPYATMQKLCLFLVLLVFIMGCRGEGPGFEMRYQRDFEIPAGLGVFDTHVFVLNGIQSNKAAFLTANGVLEEDITEIIPQNAQLSVNFANVEFLFVREVIVEIFTRDEIRGREIFFREEIPQNTGIRINLIPSLPDVKDLILQDEFNIRIEMKLRDISPQFIETRFDFEFFAKVN